jgi:uncharacterized alkaline shock family protein YloU
MEKEAMESKQELEFGEFKIADGVLELIAGVAVMEIEGISSLSGSTMQNIADFLGKKSLTKGIKVGIEDGVLSIDIHVTVDYGQPLQEVAFKAQENVKNILEAMTGINVKSVSIHIDNINFPLPPQEDEAAPKRET